MVQELRKIIIPAEIISEVYPVVQIKEDNLKQIFTGKPIHKSDLIKEEKIEHHRRTPKNLRKRFLLGAKDEIVCVFAKTRFVGMYRVVNDKDIFAKAKFVLQAIKA